MRKIPLLPAIVAGAIAVLAPPAPPPAWAWPQASEPSPEDKKAAAKEFAEGQKAFKAGDFRHAAESFEAAYGHAPHHSALWNAARAWHKADEKTRAANLYARYLEEAPANTKDRNSATEALRDLSKQLGRFEIHASELEDVRVDDQPLEAGRNTVYVTPGAHLVTAKKGGKVVQKTETAQAGAETSVVLVAPPPEPEAPPPPPPPPPERGGLSPLVVVVGGALTVVGVGATIASGADVLSQRKTFDADPSQENLDIGRSKQARTNVLLGVTVGVAALTGVVAIFFTDWGGAKEADTVKVGLGLGRVSVEGTF